MTTVKHGRRQGNSRGGTGDVVGMQGAQDQLPPVQPSARDLHHVTILSKAEWERIQLQLNERQREEERVRQALEARQQLHELSKNQINNWTNTIAGQRLQRLESHKIREEKEEEERKMIDLDEAKYQAQQRKEAIEKAKTQQYYQTDRIKTFHGALMLTEVLKERDAQVELNKLREAAAALIDGEWCEKQKGHTEEAVRREVLHQEKRAQRVKSITDFQKGQIQEHMRTRNREVAEDLEEARHLKLLAREHEDQARRLEDIRRKDANTLREENIYQIKDVNETRKQQQQQEDEEDEECRIFAAAKRKMMKLRAEKERALYNEKQVRLKKISEKLEAQMQQQLDDEDERTVKAQKEKEEKLQEEEKERMTLYHKTLREMDLQRVKQVRENEQKVADEKILGKKILKENKAADKLFVESEESKKKRRFQTLKSLQNFHVKQKEQRQAIKVVEEDQALVEYDKNQQLLSEEERHFQEYTTKVIDHCEHGGRNVYPLKVAAMPGAGGGHGPIFEGKGGLRPNYMVADTTAVQLPRFQRTSTEETKKLISGKGPTHKRLGFVW